MVWKENKSEKVVNDTLSYGIPVHTSIAPSRAVIEKTPTDWSLIWLAKYSITSTKID